MNAIIWSVAEKRAFEVNVIISFPVKTSERLGVLSVNEGAGQAGVRATSPHPLQNFCPHLLCRQWRSAGRPPFLVTCPLTYLCG